MYDDYSYSNMKEHCIGPIYGFIAQDYVSTCLLLVVVLKQAAISLSTAGEYGALPLSQCAWFYTSGNILATTCSSYSLPLELLKYLL